MYYFNEYFLPDSCFLTGMFYREWDNATEIEVYLLINSYHYYNLIDEKSDTVVPAEEVENYIQRHFDVSSDYLRSSERYKANNKTYVFPPVEGIGTSFGVNITKIEDEGGILKIYYEDAEATKYVLSIDISGQDFKYLSNLKSSPHL